MVLFGIFCHKVVIIMQSFAISFIIEAGAASAAASAAAAAASAAAAAAAAAKC